MAPEVSVPVRVFPDFEGEWKLLFKQQRAKLVHALHELAEEHLREQELLVDELLEKAKQDAKQERVSTTVSELPIPRNELIAPNELITPRRSSRTHRSHSGLPVRHTRTSEFKSYMDTEMGDLTAGVMSARHLENPVAASYLQRILALKSALEEPIRTGRLARIVNSAPFEILTFIVIAAYSAFAIWLTNQLVNNPAIVEVRGVWLAETFFLILFVSELSVKLFVHRLFFFVNENMGWNWLDFFIIFFSMVDFALDVTSNGGSVLQDVNYVRVLRVLKITKSLRILRAVRFVSELRVLMMCIVTSFAVLFWCVVLLILIQAGVSTALVQLVAGYVAEERSRGVSEEDLQLLITSFGTVQASMLELSKSTTGGIDWGSVLKRLAAVSTFAGAIYGLYLVFFFVAAWNIVTSLFIEKAMQLAQPDVQTQMLTKRKEEVRSTTEIIDLLEATDADDSGTISLSQFQEYMQVPHFRHFFEFRDLEIKDAEMFFRLLSAVSDSDDVPYDAFARGCLRMKGYASVLDVQSLRIELKTTYLHLTKLFKQLSWELNAVTGERERRKHVQDSRGDVPSLASCEEGTELGNFKNQLTQQCKDRPEDVGSHPLLVKRHPDAFSELTGVTFSV